LLKSLEASALIVSRSDLEPLCRDDWKEVLIAGERGGVGSELASSLLFCREQPAPLDADLSAGCGESGSGTCLPVRNKMGTLRYLIKAE